MKDIIQYGFIEFTNYKEFQTALSQKDPIIFGKQKLVFNSAKNKYDDDEINNNINMNAISNNENKLKLNSSDSFNENESLDTAVSNTLFSRDSNLSNKSSNLAYVNNSNKFGKNKNLISFLGENEIPNVKKIYKEEDSQDALTLKIKYALKKMEQEYFLNNMQGNNNYNYCEYFFSNRYKMLENNEENIINRSLYKIFRKDK